MRYMNPTNPIEIMRKMRSSEEINEYFNESDITLDDIFNESLRCVDKLRIVSAIMCHNSLVSEEEYTQLINYCITQFRDHSQYRKDIDNNSKMMTYDFVLNMLVNMMGGCIQHTYADGVVERLKSIHTGVNFKDITPDNNVWTIILNICQIRRKRKNEYI